MTDKMPDVIYATDDESDPAGWYDEAIDGFTPYIRQDSIADIEGLDNAVLKASHDGHRINFLMHPDDKVILTRLLNASRELQRIKGLK